MMLGNLWRLAVAGLLAVGMGSCGSRNSGTCSSLDGTWAGNEIDPYGADRGPVTFIVHGDQLAGNISDYYMDPESYELTAASNDTVTPNQLTGTVKASNQSQAVGRKFYAIYQLDPSTRTGKLSGLKPGSTTFPTAFAAGSGQRLFVFGEAGAGGAGGTSTAATAGAGGGALGGAGGNGGSLGGLGGTVKSSAGTTGTTGGSISTSGGTTGTGGTTAGGGTTGAAGTPGGHSCTPGVSPATPLISDFSPSGWYPAAGKFGTVGNLTGALFAYAGTGSTMTPGVDTTNQNLVLTGNVSAGDYAGGGMAFENAHDRDVAHEMMRLTDIAGFADQPVTNLSGGARQRVFIARALAQQPEIILLDEPNAHLDIAHQVDMFRIIKRLNTESGLTVLSVSHDLNLAAAYSDRIAMMVGGALAALGTPAEVLTGERVHEVFRTPVIVDTHPVHGTPRVSLLG